MIRKFQENDLDELLHIWLQVNLQAHDFIDAEYWQENKAAVRDALPRSELYIFEENGRVLAFIGLDGDYIAGIFVSSEAQSRGIGGQLLDHVKSVHSRLSLHVYKKNRPAMRFYLREGFQLSGENVDRDTMEIECRMNWKKEE